MPPRWRVVAALFVVTICIANSLSAFGVFLPVLNEAFGWRRGAISLALSINLVVGGIASFMVAGIADRRGPRGVLALTVLFGATGFALTSRIGEIWHFYLSYGLVVGLGMSSIYVLSAATVARWFNQGRGLALAVVLTGFNLGWLTGGPLAAVLIERVGWRSAYLAFAALIAVVGAPASFCVRFPAGGPGAPAVASGAGSSAGAHVSATFRGAITDRRLWFLVSAWFLFGLVFMTVTVHSVPYARDLGMSLSRASLVLTAYGIGAAAGRLVAGAAADRFGGRVIMHVCLLTQGMALALLVVEPPAWALTPVLVAFGVGAAGADTTFVKTVPDVFGVTAIASIMSVLGLGWRLGAAVGPTTAGFVYDLTRSYTLPFGAGLVALVIAITLFSQGTATRKTSR
jgi:OFA family oxalate/formate antiporter-like MFS transporter